MLNKRHCEVSSRYKDNPSLGSWMTTQRKHYKLMKESKSSSRSAERLEALNDAGFRWYPKKGSNVRWIEQYEELKQFKPNKVNSVVPRN